MTRGCWPARPWRLRWRSATPVSNRSPATRLGTTLVIAGDEDDGLAELARAGRLIGADRPLRDRQPDGAEFRARVRYHLNYSDALHSTGHYEDALQQALTGVEAARAVGIERDFGSFAAGNAAESMLALGRLDAAARIDRAGHATRPTDDERHPPEHL